MVPPQFCRYCGGPLSQGANFCARCGKLVAQNRAPSPAPAPHIPPPPPMPQMPPPPPMQSPPPVPQMSPPPLMQAPSPVKQAPPAPVSPMPQEVVVGVIPGAVRQSGVMGLKMENFVIVLTNSRLLFAAQTQKMMMDNVKAARDAAKQQGAGFFGQWGAQFGANSGQQYLGMQPQQILAENPGNYFLPANQLRRIHLKEVDDDDGGATQYFIEFEAVSGKQKFRLNYMRTRELKKQLQQYYGNIVR